MKINYDLYENVDLYGFDH